MSASIPSPACRPAHHLVPVPFSSRIGYRMISHRNPSHEIPNTTTSASFNYLPAPSHRSYLLPVQLPAAPCRQTGRPEARRHPTRYSLTPRLACLPSSHRSISPAHPFRPLLARLVPPPAVAIRLPPHAAHTSHQPRSISSVHPPSRPASRSASRWASRLTYLPASFVSSISSISIRFAPSHWLIALPHRMRRATSRRNGAHDGQSTTGKKERHDIRQLTDTANTPPRPPYSPYEPHNARTLTRTRPQENAPYMPITTPLAGNTR